MRIGAVLLLIAALAACGGGLFRQYEYEEEMDLALDGSATLYVNSSLQALHALRGAAFGTPPETAFDRQAVEQYFTSPATEVTRVTTSTRRGRTFVHVRIRVPDVTRLEDAPPFAWSTYEFGRDGELVRYQQQVGQVDGGSAPGDWAGDELAAFRLHAPSRVVYHNAGADNLRRGNILVWEQPLADRLRGAPVTMEVRMEAQSILAQTLWLFGAAALAVALMFTAIVWWLMRPQKRNPTDSLKSRGAG